MLCLRGYVSFKGDFMKRVLLVALICVILCCCLPVQIFAQESKSNWDGSIDTSWYSEQKNEYQIYSAAQLAGLYSLVNSGTSFEGKTIRLCSNIVLNNYSEWNSWNKSTSGLKPWTPIGTANLPFKGTFDGQGCSIVGLFVSSDSNDVGLFGVTQNATIKNINVIYAFVAGESNVGALCGLAIETDFLHCHTEANVVGNGTVGGTIGCVDRSENSGVRYIKECSSKGSVLNNVTFSSDEYYLSTKATGGVIGAYVSRDKGDTATIENCANYSNVQGTSCVGGVVGRFHTYYTQNIIIRNCVNNGNVKANDKRAGGIVGYNYQDGSLGSNNSVTVENCLNYGNVIGDGSSLGGILGFVHICSRNTSCIVRNSANINSVNVIRGARDTRYSDKVQVSNSEIFALGVTLEELKTRFFFGDNWETTSSGTVRLKNSYWNKVEFDNLTEIQEATCKNAGQTSYGCSVCCAYLGESIIGPLNHINTGWIVDREPTCQVEGERHFVCASCNETVNEQMAIVDHSYGDWTVVKGNKLIPPIVKEKACTMCSDAQTVEDWSFVWVPIVVGVVSIFTVFGLVNYIRIMKKGKMK